MPDLISHSVNSCSCPSDLKITDMRFVDIDGAPKRCTILKIETNQGITGYGEVRDASSKTYALMLKSRILGENPCNVDKIFRKIKQFGGHSRQGGGVSGIEIALWDLAGKALWRAPVPAAGRQIPGRDSRVLRYGRGGPPYRPRYGPCPEKTAGHGLHFSQDGFGR